MTGPFSGFAAYVWQILIGRRTPFILALWLAAGALLGLAAEPGQHPAEGLLLHAPAVLLPFVLWARSGVPHALVGAGLGVAFVGTLLAGGQPGLVTAQPGGETESYRRPTGARPVISHLGGILRTQIDDAEHASVRLGAGTVELGSARVRLDPGAPEVPLGPWQVRFRRAVPGATPDLARVKATAEGQPPQELLLRSGTQASLPDGTTVALGKLAADYGQGMGPAAELTVTEGEKARTDWLYVDGKDLDKRLGEGKWRLELAAVEAAPGLELEIHRRGMPWAVAVGWMLVAVGALGLGRRPAGEGAA